LRQGTGVGRVEAATTMWLHFILITEHLLWNTYTGTHRHQRFIVIYAEW